MSFSNAVNSSVLIEKANKTWQLLPLLYFFLDSSLRNVPREYRSLEKTEAWEGVDME